MKIAVIGTGISGNVIAHKLHGDHHITVFEAADRIGGHTNTIDVTEGDRTIAVDTGFIVFNDRTYPNFIQLLDELGQRSQPGEMSFSVRSEATGIEYNGASLNALFAQQAVKAAGLEHKIALLFSDYRDLEGSYDKAVSIEMVEAVGHDQ